MGFKSSYFVVRNLSEMEKIARLRAVSLFSWSVEQNARDTQMTTRVTGEARQKRAVSVFTSRAAALVSRVSQLRRLTFARACTPLTKSQEKERLLAVYKIASQCIWHKVLVRESHFDVVKNHWAKAVYWSYFWVILRPMTISPAPGIEPMRSRSAVQRSTN